MKEKIIRTTVETVYQGKVLEVRSHQLHFSDGRVSQRDVVEHSGAVVIIPRCADGAYLLVKQYRFAIQQVLLEFPAGTIEQGEDPIVCAKRELIEEVGHRAEQWQELGVLYPAPGFCNEKQTLFLANDLYAQTAAADEDEDIEVVKLSLAEIEQSIAQQMLIDAKSIAAFTIARYRGLL